MNAKVGLRTHHIVLYGDEIMSDTIEVSNVIKIKHGTSSPDGKLLPYELGVLDANEGKILYIGGEIKDGVPGIAIPLMVR